MLRGSLLVVLLIVLAGCVDPRKIEKTQADAAAFNAQRQARDANEQCSQTAMPGTVEHLNCRLAKTRRAP
ncbi:MAG TPA: hypothetical protein VG501_06900 [Rhizomicrobium sp.]|nr:hypothetical protein [Rhizomicrobium sp.]